MAKLTMESTLKKGKYANKRISDLVNVKGQIFSMIKEGYEFDDEVLEAAHIKKIIRDKRSYWRLGGDKCDTRQKVLPIETASIKQILSEINTIDKIAENIAEENKYHSYNDNDAEMINADNFYSDGEE